MLRLNKVYSLDHGLLSSHNLAKLIVMMQKSLRGFALYKRRRNLANSDFDFVNPVLPSECKEILLLLLLLFTEIVFSLGGTSKISFHRIISLLFENLMKKIKFFNTTRLTVNLHADHYSFTIYRSALLRMWNVPTKCRQIQRTPFMLNIFVKHTVVYRVIYKNLVGPEKPQTHTG